MTEDCVVDASLIVDVLVGVVDASLGATHAPAHIDAEILSALGRLARSGKIADGVATGLVERAGRAPIRRHDVAELLVDAWALRDSIALRDAIYVALAERLRLPLLTTNRRLAAAYPGAQLVG